MQIYEHINFYIEQSFSLFGTELLSVYVIIVSYRSQMMLVWQFTANTCHTLRSKVYIDIYNLYLTSFSIAIHFVYFKFEHLFSSIYLNLYFTILFIYYYYYLFESIFTICHDVMCNVYQII